MAVFTTAHSPPSAFDFLWISISKATAENGGKCCGQHTPSFRAQCGSTAQASRMYVSRTSSSHTELMPEQSQCEASPNYVACGVAQLLMWSVWKYGDYS